MGKIIAFDRIWERGYPALIAFCAIFMACHFDVNFSSARISNQLSSAITISAILMGFTGTANAMLLTFNSKRFKEIRENKHLWNLLLTYFRSALWSSLTLCFYSLILLSIDTDQLPVYSVFRISIHSWIMPLWIGSLTFALLSFFRILRAIFALLNTV